MMLKITFFFLLPILAYAESDELFVRSQFKQYGVYSLQSEKLTIYTKEKIELGKVLFFDKILSGNKNISCSTCHHPLFATGDALPISLGEGAIGLAKKRKLLTGRLIPRNAPPVFNRGYASFKKMMWDHRIRFDGDLKSYVTPEPLFNGINPKEKKYLAPLSGLLSMQAFFPVTSEDEMRGRVGSNPVADSKSNLELWDKLTNRVTAIDEYVRLFKKVYPNEQSQNLNYGHIAEAIGAFQSNIFFSNNSKFDRFLLGREKFTEQEINGAFLFVGRGKCIECHHGPHLTDFKTHALAIPQMGPGKLELGNDKGEYLMTKNKADLYKFATPTLRNVAITGPWMHDGFFTKLKDAIKHHLNPISSLWDCIKQPNMQKHPPLFLTTLDRREKYNQDRINVIDPLLFEIDNLTENEISNLEVFLHTLTDLSFKNRLQLPRSVPSKLPID